MDLTIRGTVEKKLDMQSGQGANGAWQKRDIIVMQEGKYPKPVAITFFGDRADNEVNRCNIGDVVEVAINVSSREYNDRWYSQIDGWKLDVVQTNSDNTQPSNLDAEYAAATGSERPSASKATETEDDSLPF